MISQIVVVIAIAVGILLAVVIVPLLIDWVLRADMAKPGMQVCEFKQLASSTTGTIIVFLPGLLAPATNLPDRLLKVCARYGEVWGVDYTPPRFQAHRIVDDTTDWIIRNSVRGAGVERVILVGSSLGGLLAYDVQQKLAESPVFELDLDVVVIDAPTGRDDFQRLLYHTAPLVRVLPFGPLWNHLSKPMLKLLFIPPKEGEIDKDVDLDWLAEQVAFARSYPLSFWRDQVMYILRHGTLKAGSIDSSLIYIRSTEDDDTVRPEAADKWRRAVSSKSQRSFMLDAEGAKHAAFAQNPHAYEEVFPVAFDLLNV